MHLDILIPQNRFIVSSGRLDAPLKMQPLVFGDTVPVSVRAWEYAANGSLRAVDLSTYQVALLVGPSNVRPELGFWQVSTVFGASRFIPARADAETVAIALGDTFGPVDVKGREGSYIVTLKQPGIWALPTATFQGNTLSGVLIFQITPGTVDTPAQYRIEVLEVAPARIVPANWSAGDTTPENTFTQVAGKLWQLTLSSAVDTGFFTLTVDGQATQFIAYNAAAYQIGVMLAAAGKPAEVIPDDVGGFFVSFTDDVVTAEVGGNLVILPFVRGNLVITSSGIRELLDGVEFAPVKLSVVLKKDANTITTATAEMVLRMPVNQPAVITIDTPSESGLTFAVNEDGSMMHVYQNGVWLYDVVLNAPV